MIKTLRDNVNTILSALENMPKKRVLVGIPLSESGRKDGMLTNAELGYIHENGSAANNIPPRPFLVPGVRAASEKCVNVLKQYAVKQITGKGTIEQGLNAAGLIAQSSVKKRIQTSEGIAPLSEKTLKARERAGKKGTRPLIRTGQLINSITYVIREK